jgi:hypothetical protein
MWDGPAAAILRLPSAGGRRGSSLGAMTDEAIPQVLDDAVYRKYMKRVKSGKYNRILDSLLAAEASVRANPFAGEPHEGSVGTIIHILVDAVRVLNGEIGTFGTSERVTYEFGEEFPGAWQRTMWQEWASALEFFDVSFGIGLGDYVECLRAEMVEPVDPDTELSVTARMLRLWGASKPFRSQYYRWSMTLPITDYSSSFDAEEAGVRLIMAHCFGLPENWSAETWALERELTTGLMEY